MGCDVTNADYFADDADASLKISKTANTSGPVGPCEQIKYEIVLCNTCDINITDINVYDDLLKGSPFTIPGTLLPGQCKNVAGIPIYTVTDDDLCNGSIVSTAKAKAYDCSGNMITATSCGPMIRTAFDASFEINKTANVSVATVGKVIGYTIVVNNTGNVTIQQLKLEDDITGEVWNVSPLAPGKSKTLHTSYTVEESDIGRPITNTLFATSYVGPCGAVDSNKLASVTVPTACPENFSIMKTALQKTIKHGEEIDYLIQVKTNFPEMHNVVVKDVFNKHVEFISASPTPEADGIWRFSEIDLDNIPASYDGWKTIIALKVKAPEAQDFEFVLNQGVAGEGFVNVANYYSTAFDSYVINNCIYVTTEETGAKVYSDCESVTVTCDLGTELSTREHGSGLYESEELLRIKTEKESISMNKDMAAIYKSTDLGLYNNRTVEYSSRWTEGTTGKNRVTGASMSECYRYAKSIDRESSIFLDKNESVMEVNSEFDGMGHVGFLKMPINTSTLHETPLFEFLEDYTGSFKILERVDEYGLGTTSEKSASGDGLVTADKRIGESQRSYESGTGSYDAEELIETYTNYIAKDISLGYAPMSQSFTDDVSIDASQKWKEGMYSKTPGASYIGEEYTSITSLDKETVAKGLNEMDTEANFSGWARYRAVLEDEADFDEQYEGDYSIERRIIITGVAKYDRPHLNVTKTLDGIEEVPFPWGYDEAHLAGEIKKRAVATYNITIENDGSAALGPIYVRDLFPPGSTFIESSSVRPTETADNYANWTLTHLGIGDAAIIILKLDVTKCHPDELVNRVEACGGYNDEWVCAYNFSTLEIDWLSCRSDGVSVKVVADLDDDNLNVVRYRVEIANSGAATRVATVTDRLPDGMKFLESSVPIASYEKGVIVWNLVEIEPAETVTIEFSALAPGEGRFTNAVEVDPKSVDGPVVQPVSATCVVDVGVVEGECGPISCDAWQPPNWGLEHYGYGPNELTCE